MIENRAASSGYHHIGLGAVGSTNDEAMKRARAGADLPLWITAERQIDGRGRQGARWTSEVGNLYASLALKVADTRSLPELPLVASVALHDALVDGFGENISERLKIKWPNDLLLDGKKVCGILAESQTETGADTQAVVGMGVNLAHHPDETRYPATNFAAAELFARPSDIFISLKDRMAARLEQWQASTGNGFQTIRSDWIDRATGLGQTIEVRLPEETLSGRFDGLDQSGRLILHRRGLPDRPVSAGEIFFSSYSSNSGNVS